MNVDLFIALRYLRARRREKVISLVSFMALAGVFIGVMTMIVVLSVSAGFEEDLKEKILGFSAHIVVFKLGGEFREYREIAEKIETVPGVVAASPFIMTQALLSSKRGVSGVVLYGIFPEKASRVLAVREAIRRGEGDLREVGKGDPPGIAVGKELAKLTSLYLGDEVTLVSPQGEMTPLGMVPRFKKFRVVAKFDAGMYEYDSTFVFAHIKDVQKFFNMGDVVSGIDVRIEDPDEAETIANNIKAVIGFPRYYTRTWMDMNRSLFSALRLEKVVFFIILTLIVLVASFNIVTTLTMTVMEKRKDIAILRAMGASRGRILRIFLYQGLIIGLVGEVLGIGSALLLCELLKKYQFIKLPADVYYISTLPVKVEPLTVFLIAFVSFLLVLVASLYPAKRAADSVPSEILRYE